MSNRFVPACGSCGASLVDGGRFCAKCGSPVVATVAGDPLIGKLVGGCRILSVLGEGAMGKVYRAEQTNLGRIVCVKTLLPHMTQDRTLVQRFEREARAVSGLRHPNIVSLFDFGRSEEGTLYIVMELVEGSSLRSLIEKEAPLPMGRALPLLGQILSAVEEAHGAGVIHRDLKPENVLLGRLRDGSDLVKVVDFGIAKVVTPEAAGQQLTAVGLVCGTPGYMAPEQIMGQELSASADVYAAGVILFELLTGKPPYASADVQDLLRLHLTGHPPAPSSMAKLPLPASLDAVVLRSLERQRDRRFRTALDFKRALDVFEASQRQTQLVSAAKTQVAATLVGEARCPKCAHSNPGGTKFCGECGSPLGIGVATLSSLPIQAQASVVSADFGSLGGVMPQKLLGHLADMQNKLAGEKRNVTVIFADVSGFTAMSETLEAEEVRQVMNRCFDGMVEAVHRYDGTVDKFIGDCIMVLFGAPNAHEDDPERAVRCALDMLAYLDQVNKTLKRPLGMRVGINAGEVVAGGVGGQRRMDYTVMGDVVNTAQRLETASKVGKILVSRSVQRLTETKVVYRELPPVTVKGKKEPLAVFEVVKLAEAADRQISTFVGRADQMAELEAALAEAAAGRANATLVLGEPGLGKSRLLEEVGRRARGKGFEVARAGAGRFGSRAPLELVRGAIFSLAGGHPKDAAEADVRLKSLGKYGLDPHDLGRLLHLFGSAAGSTGLDREDAKRLDQATVLLLFIAAARNGLCLLLDDLHLADAASLEYVETLIQRAGGAKLCVVGSSRPGDTEKLLGRARRLDLRPLEGREVVDLVRGQLSAREIPDVLVKLLSERAEGNPYFALEIVRNLIAARTLQLSGGSWLASDGIDASSLPESVNLLMGARLDKLSAPAKQFLRYGAVAGRVFPLDLVAAALDTPIDLQAAVGECVNQGFLSPSDQPPGSYQFVQNVIHEVILAGVTRADLRHAHLRVGEAIERGIAPGGEHPSEAMGRHFVLAGQIRKAVRYLVLAGDRLAERHDFGAAAERYREVLELSLKEGAKAGPPSEGLAVHLFQVAGKAILALGMVAPDRALEVLDPVVRWVPAELAREARAEALRQKGLVLLKQSRVAEAETALVEALRNVEGIAQPEAIAKLRADFAAALEARGELAGATTELLEGFRLLGSGSIADRDLIWSYLNQLGRVHLRLKQVEKARDFFENARTQAKSSGSVVGESKAVANLAGAVATQGELAQARALFVEAMDLAQKAGDRVGVARIQYNVGRLLLSMGDQAEGLSQIQAAQRLSSQLGWREGFAAATQTLEALKAQQDRPRQTRA